MSEKDDLEILKALREIPTYVYKSIFGGGFKGNRRRIKSICNLGYENLSESGKIDALIGLGIPDHYPGLGRIDKEIITACILEKMTLNEDAKITTSAGRFLNKLGLKKLACYVDNIVCGFKANPENVDAAGASGWLTIPMAIGMIAGCGYFGLSITAALPVTTSLLAASFLIFLDEVARDGKKAKLLEGTSNLPRQKTNLLERSSLS